MKILEALILAVLFYSILADQIKKKTTAFYTGTYVLTALVIAYSMLGWGQKLPVWFTEWGMSLFQRGAFSTATFIIVMYLGVVRKHNAHTLRLLKIRGEISIIGCILALGHNVVYGIVYFPALFYNRQSLDGLHLAAAILTIALLILILPLFLTSFQCIRKKMKAKTWKKLQRLAYPFFYLIYVHVMVLYAGNAKEHMADMIIYTVIYLLYTILRLRKYILQKLARESKKYSKN